jgi:hypothetical protein
MTTVSTNVSAFLGQCEWENLPPQENQSLEEVNTFRLNRRFHTGYKNRKFYGVHRRSEMRCAGECVGHEIEV